MLTGDRIIPRPAEKTLPAPAEPAKVSRIEEIAARLAELERDRNELDVISVKLRNSPSGPMREFDRRKSSAIENEMKRILREIWILEEMLSISKPQTASEILITTAVASYRVDALKFTDIEKGQPAYEKDCAILESTFSYSIPALEQLAGVTLKELGLECYFSLPETPKALAAGFAELKEASVNGLCAFTGLEPITDRAEYELLKDQLRRIIVAFKAIQDLDAYEDDDPLYIALFARAKDAENAISVMADDSLAVAAAKLAVARMGELRQDINERDYEGGWTQDSLCAQAALKAIEWFGLKDLYDAYAPEESEAAA